MLWNKVDGVPLYIRIRDSLRQDLLSGKLTPGQKLPSEDELAERFGVSRMTVRQGVSDLVDEGLLYRRQGIGTIVAAMPVQRDHTRLTNFFESSQMQGIETSAKVLTAEVIPSKLQAANQLGLSEGDPVHHIKTLRYAKGVPITVHDAYLPYRLFPRLIEEDLASRHLWDYLESHGYRIKRAIQKMEARDADEELATLLQVEVGAPILYKERTIYSDQGVPVEFLYCYNRGDRYSVTVTLYR